MENNIKIGIVLVNFNSSIDTVECVRSIKNSSYKNYEIVIVDNCSEIKEFNKLLVLQEEKIKIIREKSNLGFAAANNIGISYSMYDKNCDVIWLLNNDTIIDTETLKRMVDSFCNNEDIGIMGCLIRYYSDKSRIWFGGGMIKPWQGRAIHFTKKEDGVKNFDFLTGCSMMIPKAVIENVGMLSEKYFLYYEDTDYCLKVLKKGWKLAVNFDTFIYHKVSSSTKEYSDLYFYYFIRNRFIFIRENLYGIIKVSAYSYSFLSMLYKILKYKKKSIWLGFVDFLKRKGGKCEDFISRI